MLDARCWSGATPLSPSTILRTAPLPVPGGIAGASVIAPR